MKQAQTNYYQNLIEENGSDQRKLFKLSKELLNLNLKQLFPQHSDNYILANSSRYMENSYFETIA